jgi:hypothetical protein
VISALSLDEAVTGADEAVAVAVFVAGGADTMVAAAGAGVLTVGAAGGTAAGGGITMTTASTGTGGRAVETSVGVGAAGVAAGTETMAGVGAGITAGALAATVVGAAFNGWKAAGVVSTGVSSSETISMSGGSPMSCCAGARLGEGAGEGDI